MSKVFGAALISTLFVYSQAQSPINIAQVDTKVRSTQATDRRTIVSTVIDGVNNTINFPASDLLLSVDFEDIFSMKTDLFVYLNDNNEVLQALNAVRCGSLPPSVCTIAPYVLANPVQGRTSFKISASTEFVDDLGFYPGENPSFDQALIDYVNNTINDPAFNFSVSDIDTQSEDGSVHFTYTVQKPYDAEPSTTADFERATITKTGIETSLLGVNGVIVKAPAIDYCVVRDCNGGVCNSNTGVCSCINNRWGISCEVECVCQNGGTCGSTHCKCSYPYKGRTCAVEAVECSDGSCV